MKIGILGAGHIGGTLGRHWAKAGHVIFFGSRHSKDLEKLVRELATEPRQALSKRLRDSAR